MSELLLNATEETKKRRELHLLQTQEISRILIDPQYFIFNFFKTYDPHDRKQPSNKPFPNEPFLREVIREIHAADRAILEKSRQMLITWVICGYILWDAMFKESRREFMQTKKEDDADELVKRCWYGYETLPMWLRKKYKAVRSYCKIEFPSQNSVIQGLPQSSESLRLHVGSIVFFDEAAYLKEFEEMFAAAVPMTGDGGKIIIASTPNGRCFFRKLIYDET